MKWTVFATMLTAVLPASAPPALAQQGGNPVLPGATQAEQVQVTTFARGLTHPWGMAFLPDGRLLVTERPGRLRVVSPDGQASAPVQGVPAVFAEGQGGLLDVALDPDFTGSRRIYLSFAEAGPNGTASTAVARGRLDETATRLQEVQVIFRQEPKVSGGNHFGSRLAFSPQGQLFVTSGERFKFQPAQDLASGLGKVMRINPDGSVPPDDPFVGRADARPEIWSYGHRNVQGAAINPATGALWIHEFGPRGGDELNIPEPGRNYGWPLVSWGRHYTGEAIPAPTTRPDLAGSVRHWTPVISPSGMIFYTGDAFPGWHGNILIGGLTARGIIRLELNGNNVTGEHRIALGHRIRDVEQGPDGTIYAATDEGDGEILRLMPVAGGGAR